MASLKKLGTGKPKASVASRQASEARRRYAKASEPLAAALAAEAPGIAMRDAAFKASRPAPVAISKPAPKTRASLASDADGGGVLKAVAHKVVDGAADPEFRASLDRKLQNEMSRLEQVRTRARITRAAAGLAPVEASKPPSDQREIGQMAVWSLSTAKPGNGVEQLRDDNIETYWQ